MSKRFVLFLLAIVAIAFGLAPPLSAHALADNYAVSMLPTPVVTIEQVSVQRINATNALVTFRIRVTDSAGHPIQGRVELRGRLHGSTASRTFFGGSQLGADGRAYLTHHYIPGRTPQQWDYRVVYPRGQTRGFARGFIDRIVTR